VTVPLRLVTPMSAALTQSSSRAHGPRVVVVGAGAFGGWTALHLAELGAAVTLIDAWGPGNTRASSGGETRVIRSGYGTRSVYTGLAARALGLWREFDRRWERGFYRKTGALWLFGRDDSFGRASAAALDAHQLPYQWLSAAEAAKRYPQISFTGVQSVFCEQEAGYLLARRACEFVVERLVAGGGTFRLGAIGAPVRMETGVMRRVMLETGESIEADAFVFACGPWLDRLFPDVLGKLITPTRQEVFYFGPPAGDDRFSEDRLPVWIDFDERVLYGIPGNANRGFKLADDTSGPRFDPTAGSRELTTEAIKNARAFLARRFPALAGAPLLGGEVCQYEASPDSHFIIDRHPEASNVWIAGGGSGHGFKMGPAIGEVLADAVLGRRKLNMPDWRLARFSGGVREERKWI
jgi:glycine/D-amino acid oxidase-like deaminating enzyme